MHNERFNFQPPADTDGVTKILNLTAADLKVPARVRTVADIESLAAYLGRWGKQDRTVVYCDGGKVVAVLDEEQNDDKIVLAMKMTRQAEIWLPIMRGQKGFTHKAFKEFLEDRYPEIEDGAAFFASVSNLSLATTFTYDAKLSTERSYSIKVESDDSASVTKLPKHINIEIPLWNGLAEPDLPEEPGHGIPNRAYVFPVKLLFTAPSEGQKQPLFAIDCESLKDVLEQAERDITKAVRAALEGWQVINGQPGSTRA